MRARALLLPALLGVALLLGGCGGSGTTAASSTATTSSAGSPSSPASSGSDPVPAPTYTQKPAAGPKFSGKGYAFHTPQGWTDATKRAKKLNAMVALAATDKPDSSGFATNVNVVVADAGVQQPSSAQLTEISQAIKKRLKSLVPRLRVDPTTSVDGAVALHHEGPATKSGVKYYIDQYVAFQDGKAYTVTFSYGRTTSTKQRAKVSGSVLSELVLVLSRS